jgi:DNA-binding LacI/PurR family transcriptional regulator
MQHMIRERVAPVAAFGRPQADLACLTVDHDKGSGARRVGRYLARRGYERIACIASDQWYGDWALDGLRDGLQDAGLELDPRLTVRVGDPQHEGARGAVELLERGPFDAVFVDSDMRALAAVDHFRRAGLRIPDDLAVVGYDGLDNAISQPPYLTSVRVPHDTMVREALEIADNLNGNPMPDEHRDFVGQIIEGRTAPEKALSPSLEK